MVIQIPYSSYPSKFLPILIKSDQRLVKFWHSFFFR